MSRRPFSTNALNGLRTIGDPAIDGHAVDDPHAYFKAVARFGLVEALNRHDPGGEVMRKAKADLEQGRKALEDYGADIKAAILRARDRFTYYSDEISAALLL